MTNPWQTIDAPVIDIGTGGEELARAVAVQIALNLDAQCTVQENLWNQRDQDWAKIMRRPYFATKLERVPPERVYTGARPTLVESDWHLWPAITTRVGQRNPSDDREQMDQYDSMDLQLIIEVLAKAGPFREVLRSRDPSEEIDRQYQRLSDAVVGCIAQDKTLGGHVLPIKRPPRMMPSMPFARKMDKGAGEQLLFQGMELTYTVTKLLY